MAAATTASTDDPPPYNRPGTPWTPLGNAVPLITEYTFPTACRSRWWYIEGQGSEIAVHSGDNPIAPDPIFSDCVPFGTDVFSPGMCPHGQTLGAVTEQRLGTDRYFEGPCCQRGYTLNAERYVCEIFASDPVAVFVDSQRASSLPPDFGDLSTSCNTISNSDQVLVKDSSCKAYTVVSSVTLSANDMYIVWKEQDMSLFPLSYQSYLVNTALRDQGLELPRGAADTGSSSPASSLTSSTNPATSDSANTPAPSKVNAGTIAGSVVGAVAGVIFIIVLIWYILRRRQRRRSMTPAAINTYDYREHVEELPDSQVEEMPFRSQKPEELSGGIIPTRPVELGTDR